jgi:putative endopeptidase
MRSSLSLVVLVLVVACGTSALPPGAPPATAPVRARAGEPAPSPPVVTRSLAAIGLDPDAIDRTADPCDDFYQFACGGWTSRAEIPADRPIVMRGIMSIVDRNLEYEHALLEGLRANPGGDPAAHQLGAFYGSCTDEAAIERQGLAALRPALAAIDKIRDLRSLATALGQLHASGVPALFELASTQDAADAQSMIAGIDQGGLGLPDRDYYLNDDEPSRTVRAAYLAYAETLLAAIGHRAAHQAAVEIVALETRIARISLDKVAHRDARGTYHKLDRAGLAQAMPRLDWRAFWVAVGLPGVREITVASPALLVGLNELLGAIRPETWRSYLAFHVAADAAGWSATRVLDDARFKLSSTLTGQPELPPRWKRCIELTERGLGDLIGQAFVRDRFGGASRIAAETYVHAIVAAMTANLDALPWMDPATKVRAQAKLDAMTYQIGYPRTWKTYEFRIDPKAWAANAFAARRAEAARDLAKIGVPVDRDDWLVSAADVTAYYLPQLNTMSFPAGILQPPFYSASAAIPVNLGAMGVVVGHELTHGFDDQGAQYDGAGNLVNWWEPDTQRQFEQRTRCVIDQYSGYRAAGTRLDGAHTVGEDLADIGGVKLALAACHQLRAGAPAAVIADGFTEDQQFFLGFGQAWCAVMRPDYERLITNIDPHPPARWRVNGALSATPEFASAFHCKAGAKMVPIPQCVVW